MQLKLFRKEASSAKVRATAALLEQDLQSGVLYWTAVPWEDVLQQAALTAKAHTHRFGCRSLDILHCCAARSLTTASFVTTDTRQRRLAKSLGLKCPSI